MVAVYVYVFEREEDVRGEAGVTLYVVQVDGRYVVFTDKPLSYAEPVYQDDSPVIPSVTFLTRKAREILGDK